MQISNYRGPSMSTGSSDSGPIGKFIGVAFISVPVAMAAVGLQMGIEALFEEFFRDAAASARTAIPTIITAIFQGAATATMAQWAFGRYDFADSRQERLRSLFTAALTGAAIGFAFSGLIEGNGGGGSGAGGDAAADFFPAILAMAIIILFCAVVGSVIFVIFNRGLMSLGLKAAAGLAEDAGKRAVEKLAPNFIQEKWWGSYNEKEDKSFALAKGFAKGTRWLTTCKRSDSNAIVSGLMTGAVSGAATFHLEAFAHSPKYGFFWQVFVELFGSFAGLIGGCVILAFVVAVFRYPLRLLRDIVLMVFVGCLIVLLLKACAR
jgi:hypothetical protein